MKKPVSGTLDSFVKTYGKKYREAMEKEFTLCGFDPDYLKENPEEFWWREYDGFFYFYRFSVLFFALSMQLTVDRYWG